MGARELRIQILPARRLHVEVGFGGDDIEDEDDAEISTNELSTQSVALLDNWLNCWEGMRRANFRWESKVLRPQTFELMGRHLWRLLFTKDDGTLNDVGSFVTKELGTSSNPPLRVLIEFDTDADEDLKGLPWEFLFQPIGEGGKFLAVETSLMLTRYVSPPAFHSRRAPIAAAAGNLWVQVINALPRGRDTEGVMAWLNDVEKEIRKVPGIRLAETIDAWDPDSVTRALTKQPCRVVHVVGLCRGVPGKPEMYTGAPGHPWSDDPKPFVEAFTKSVAEPPQLVILQLWDFQDGDASENFERVAPALIKAGIPAVLATQYAPSIKDSGLGAKFYTLLNQGESIGEAVQQVRGSLAQSSPAFAAPVLYLQDDGALVGRPERGTSTKGVPATPDEGGGAIDDPKIRSVLLKALDAARLDPDTQARQEQWLSDLKFKGDIRLAQSAVRRRGIQQANELRPLFKAMGKALESLEREAAHA